MELVACNRSRKIYSAIQSLTCIAIQHRGYSLHKAHVNTAMLIDTTWLCIPLLLLRCHDSMQAMQLYIACTSVYTQGWRVLFGLDEKCEISLFDGGSVHERVLKVILYRCRKDFQFVIDMYVKRPDQPAQQTVSFWPYS